MPSKFDQLFLIDRRHRMDALLDLIEREGISRHWRLVGKVWSDTESVAAYRDEWAQIWARAYDRHGARRPRSLHVMCASDRRAFSALPEVVELWRGCNHQDGIISFSWTTDREKAEWFARRFAFVDMGDGWIGQGPILATCHVHRSIVLARFNDRKESEVVIDPECLMNFTWEFLPEQSEIAA